MEKESKLIYYPIMFGSDPEFFFRKDDEVVGADKILPRSGLVVRGTNSKIIIDGVQAELNPEPASCREVAGHFFSLSFQALKERMAQFERLKIDFSQTVKLSDEDFERLSDDSKKFGCMPSMNAGNKGKAGVITVNPATYRFRSAGGHIHIGNTGHDGAEEYLQVAAALEDPVRLVKMLDILLGNTCVLIDRSPGNIERRKVYGKAGEFRTPPHGIEYRTLSNFWLRSYQLMSFVFGMTRTAVIIVANDMDGKFLELVDMKDIQQAIDTNNFTLALSNFRKIEKLLFELVGTESYGSYPLRKDNIKEFRHFVKKGMDYWFKEDPMDHWTSLPRSGMVGFSEYLHDVVGMDLAMSSS